MAPRAIAAIGWILVVGILAGCGDSGGTSSGAADGSQAAGQTPGGSGDGASREPADSGDGASGGSDGSQSAGKPARPAPASDKPPPSFPVLSQSDCKRLKAVLISLGPRVSSSSSDSSGRISNCTLYVKTGFISISLDGEPPRRERFLSGIRSNPQRRPVAGMGEPLDGKPGAYWVPELHRLFIWRRSGWFTLFFPYRMPEGEAHRDALRLGPLAVALASKH